jgi:two-component system response regulator NreC
MSKHIFIVDDNQAVRRLVRFYLESQLEHIVCGEAVDGPDAIKHAMEVQPDLILLDFCMPGQNGLDAAAILHGMLPGVPIILYTLHKDIVPKERAQSAGIHSVVSKSDPLDVLLGEILNFVGVARSASA